MRAVDAPGPTSLSAQLPDHPRTTFIITSPAAKTRRGPNDSPRGKVPIGAATLAMVPRLMAQMAMMPPHFGGHRSKR